MNYEKITIYKVSLSNIHQNMYRSIHLLVILCIMYITIITYCTFVYAVLKQCYHDEKTCDLST